MEIHKIVKEKLIARTYKVVSLEYPTRNGKYSNGGWSSRAKHKPQPQRKVVITKDIIFDVDKKAVLVNGQRKLKVNIFDATTREVIFSTYSLQNELTKF